MLVLFHYFLHYYYYIPFILLLCNVDSLIVILHAFSWMQLITLILMSKSIIKGDKKIHSSTQSRELDNLIWRNSQFRSQRIWIKVPTSITDTGMGRWVGGSVGGVGGAAVMPTRVLKNLILRKSEILCCVIYAWVQHCNCCLREG